RDGAGRRRFADDDVVRVAVILRSKAAGLGLGQVAALLDGGAPQRHEVLEAHLADLDRRAEGLARARAMAQPAFGREEHDVARCPRFAGFVEDILAGMRVTPGAWGSPGPHAHG